MTQFTRNILKVYRSATPAQVKEGMEWYPTANAIALDIANGDIWMGAGLISAYSPLTPWWRNVELATDSARSGIARTDTLPTNYRPAQRILAGEDAREVIKGIKTNTFMHNIADSGISDRVTVDVHAFSIAQGTPVPSSALKMGKPLYNEIAECYRRAAKIEDIMPTEMQAITWGVWRDRYPSKRKKGTK